MASLLRALDWQVASLDFPAGKKRKAIKMKIVPMAAMAALISLGVPQAHALQTNVVQGLSILLGGVQPGGPVTNRSSITRGIASARIETRQVIQALGAATVKTFSQQARLVIVTPLGGGNSSI